jgi:Flp pilus assembly secretin CpaC
MISDRIQSRPKIAVCVVVALLAISPASIVRAADPSDSMRLASASDPAAKTLQLGVGKSVIVELPEEAGEIYVGDPKIANASSAPRGEFIFPASPTARPAFSRWRETAGK